MQSILKMQELTVIGQSVKITDLPLNNNNKVYGIKPDGSIASGTVVVDYPKFLEALCKHNWVSIGTKEGVWQGSPKSFTKSLSHISLELVNHMNTTAPLYVGTLRGYKQYRTSSNPAEAIPSGVITYRGPCGTSDSLDGYMKLTRSPMVLENEVETCSYIIVRNGVKDAISTARLIKDRYTSGDANVINSIAATLWYRDSCLAYEDRKLIDWNWCCEQAMVWLRNLVASYDFDGSDIDTGTIDIVKASSSERVFWCICDYLSKDKLCWAIPTPNDRLRWDASMAYYHITQEDLNKYV